MEFLQEVKFLFIPVTGAKVNNYVYDGNQLSLGHLNPGVYFMNISGFTSQKLIKE